MKASIWIAPVATVAILFGAVGVGEASGQFVTTGRQEATASQRLAAADLKGWMTLQQAADGLGMDVSALVALIGPPPGVTLPPSTAFKDVEGLVPGFELSSLREKLGSPAGGAEAGASPSASGSGKGAKSGG